MTEPERPQPGGTHRRSPRASRGPVLLASLGAVAVVAIAVVVVLNARGEPAGHVAPPAASSSLPDLFAAPPSPGTPPSRGTPSPGNPSSGTSPSAVGPATHPASPVAPTSARTAVTPAPGTAAAGQGGTPAPSAPLDVLNDSRITGLAHRAAGQFRVAGWDVAVVGNFTGSKDVPETTIFFPDGAEAAATRLAARFGVDRVLPAPSFLSGSHLSVVLARDWDDAR